MPPKGTARLACSQVGQPKFDWEHMLPPPEKIITIFKKTIKNLAHTSQYSIFYVHAPISRKTDISCVLCKKNKKSQHENNHFFRETTFFHDVRTSNVEIYTQNFLSEFFNISNNILKHILKTVPKCHPCRRAAKVLTLPETNL
jgi:hypothetical protein